jgi:hypothetical protein
MTYRSTSDIPDPVGPMHPWPRFWYQTRLSLENTLYVLMELKQNCWAGMFWQRQTLGFANWLAQSLGSFLAQPLDVQRSDNS